MKICLINRSFSNPTWDGISTYTHNLGLGLVSYGHDVSIITRKNDKKLPKSEKSNIQIISIRPIFGDKINQNSFIGQIGTMVYHLQVLIKLIKLDLAHTFDVIEAPEVAGEGFFPSIFFRHKLITRLHTPITVIWFLNGQRIGLRRKILANMEKYQINHSRWVSAPTFAVIKKVYELFGVNKKIRIYQNLLNDFSDRKFLPVKEKNYILFVGKIQKNKGFNVFIDAFKSVEKVFPNLIAVMIGDIDKMYGLEKFRKVEQESVNSGIKCLMGITNEMVLSYMKNAKIVVMPSFWENSSYALIEALMLGKITIVSSGGGFKEIIKDGQNGFLVVPRSVSSLSKKIIDVLKLSQSEQKKIEISAKKTSRIFLPEEVIPKVIDLYNESKILNYEKN